MFSDRLQSLVSDCGVSHKTNRSSYIFDCPKCGKRDKLYIRRNDGLFQCWVCADSGFRGKPEYALAVLTGRSVREVREYLYDYDKVVSDGPKALSEQDDEIVDEFEVYDMPQDFVFVDSPEAIRGAKYLESRGIPLGIANRYDIRYCSDIESVVFPAYVHGVLRGWQTRKIYDPKHGPKALTFGEKSQFVLFHDFEQIHHPRPNHVIICEGPIDAIKCHLVGGAIAIMGKTISDKQIEIVRNMLPEKIYLALDPDAWRATEKIIDVFAFASVPTYQVEVPGDYKDIGQMPFEAVKELFWTAKPASRENKLRFSFT